jgi:hypothetical protein
MMVVFHFGIGVSCLLASITQNAWQLAAALTLMGAFASIYHPVGIPMLVQHTTRPAPSSASTDWSAISASPSRPCSPAFS